MNIDDLKGAWSESEPDEDMKLPVSTAMLGKTTSAVVRIRRNMKSEFIGGLIAYVFLIFLLFYGNRSADYLNTPSVTINITLIVIFILFILNVFYFSRFYLFYRSFSHYDLSLRESIRKIAYELELNIEIYKTYNFCVTPLAVLITFMLLCGKNGLNYMQLVLATNAFTSPLNLFIIYSTILISFIVTYACINHHLRSQYGKYIVQLKQVMDDFED